MKVLHVIPSISAKSGGPGQAILPLCRSLKEQGLDITLVGTDAELNETTKQIKMDQANEAGLHLFLFPSQAGSSFKYSRPLSRWLDENVSSFDLVHIHAVFNHASIAAARACFKHAIPYVVRPLGTLDPWSLSQKRFRKQAFRWLGVNAMLKRAAGIHYTTKAEQEAVASHFKMNHGFVAPLGIDLQPPATTSLANHFPQLSERPYVLVLSRLHPKKALEVLLKAFIGLVRREPFGDWRLVIAGEGSPEYEAELKNLVEVNGGTQSIVFTGWLDGPQKEAMLQNASLLALTSHQENFGLCVVEALAKGVPVLVSPAVNLAPEIERAQAGWVVPVNELAIERTLSEALASNEERLKRGKAGREFVKQFEWTAVGRQLFTTYRMILEGAAVADYKVARHG